MTKEFDIQEYMTKGVERVVSDAIRATLKNPKESAYMAKFALASKGASSKRKQLEEKGEHPDFETVKKEIEERDHRDMTRENSPLKQAEDAVLIDSSDMTIDEVKNAILEEAQGRL